MSFMDAINPTSHGFWKTLDPTSNNFMGWGPTLGRIMGGIASGGGAEFHRTDPFATTPGTQGNKVGRGFGGAGPGAVGGFITGGPWGAAAGGATGFGEGYSGLTNSTTPAGWGENFGSGLGAGKLAAMSSYMGGESGGGGGAAGGGGASGGGMGGSSSSPVASALQMMRGGGQEQQPAQSQGDPHVALLQRIYQIYPGLRPGGGLGQHGTMGGMYGA